MKTLIPGKLYLIPSLLGDDTFEKVVAPFNTGIVSNLTWFIVEEIRSARRFIKKACKEKVIDDLHFLVYNEHTKETDLSSFLQPLLEGNDVGLLSEAGLPCVADPGSLIVKAAHEKGIIVVPLSGPSSIMLALMASGFNGQQFCFHGYLPVDKPLRAKKIHEMEHAASLLNETQIFIEAPYRNLQVFEAILQHCGEGMFLCIATGLTTAVESIKVMTVKEWKRHQPDINKKPTVFLLAR